MRISLLSFCLLPACGLVGAGSALAQFSPANTSTISTANNPPQTLAGGTGTITSTGSITSTGTAASLTLSGTDTRLDNSGTISNTGASGATARAIMANGTNLQIFNLSGGIIQSAGNNAILSNMAATTISLNNAGAIQGGSNQQAVDLRAVTGANAITNSGSIFSTGADAVRPGANSVIINSGTIRATPVQSGGNASGSDGIDNGTVSGIQITNSGTIEGRHGITGGATPYSLTITNNLGGLIKAVNGSGVNIDGVAATAITSITNNAGATITGDWDGVSANGDGDGVDVDGVINLTNRGTIQGLGANGNGSDGLPNGPDGVAAGGGMIVNETGGKILAAATHGSATESHGILVDNSSQGNAIAATTIINRGTIQSDNGYAIRLISALNNTITNDTGGTIQGTGAMATIQSGDGDDTVTNRGTITSSGGAAIDLQGGNDALIIEGGAAAVSGSINGGAGTNTLSINPGSGQSFAYAGTISNFNAVQVQSGTAALSGKSNYTGTTTVASGGTLLANDAIGTAGSATGAGPVSVQGGGTLGGVGRVGGNVSVAANGIVAPGNGAVGMLTVVGSVDALDGSAFTFELGPNQAQSDFLSIGMALNFTGPGQIVINILDNGVKTGSYQLIGFASMSGLTTANVRFGQTPAGFAGSFDLSSGTGLALNVSAVPEPSSSALLGAAALVVIGAAAYRRRTQGRASSTN